MVGGGRGTTTQTVTDTRGQRSPASLPLDRLLSESRWGHRGRREGSPAQVRDPQHCAEDLGSNFQMVSPHRRHTDVSSPGEVMPFCFILERKPPREGLVLGALLWNPFPEPPTTGHVTCVLLPAGPRQRGPSCHVSFAKSP